MILNEVSEGRWLSPDPLGGDITNPQSLNRYAYALNNPTTLTDPSGLGSQYSFGNGCVLESDSTSTQTVEDNGTLVDTVTWGPFEPILCLPSFQPWLFGPPIVSVRGGGGTPAPKPAPVGLRPPSYGQVLKSFNNCAANFADKYSVASLLHLGNVPVLGSVFGSSTAAASSLVFGTRPSEYVPAGANLAAGAKAGTLLAATATSVSKIPIDQGFQSVFTTIPATQLGETAAGSSVVKGAEGAASLLDSVVEPLVLWDELTYGYGEAACAAKSF